MVWFSSPLDLLLGCTVNLGRYPSMSIFTGAGCAALLTGAENQSPSSHPDGAIHGKLVVPYKYLYGPSRWLPQMRAPALQMFRHNPCLGFPAHSRCLVLLGWC